MFTLDEKGAVARTQQIPSPSDGTMAYGLGWSADGKRLLCSLLRLPDRMAVGLAFYSPDSNTLSDPISGVKTGGGARRGAFLGERAVITDADGIHVVDPAAGTERLIVSSMDLGRYGAVTCRGATTCFGVRITDNADIWMRTVPERGNR